jgi:hypothetical protein
MTFYLVFCWSEEKKEWVKVTDEPEHYLDAKAEMLRMKKDKHGKYKLFKTSY